MVTNYKMFIPKGAKEFGKQIILENGMSFPRYAFIAVPIVGLKSNISRDVLSDNENRPVYFDTKTNTFTTSKKVRNITPKNRSSSEESLSSSSHEGLIKFNFDGYINISSLISNVKKQIQNIKEKETNLVAFEQDVGFTSVKLNNLINYEIVTVDPNDDYLNIDYRLSENLVTRDLLKYQLRPQTLNAQRGVSKSIIIKNLKNIAVNVYEPLINFITSKQNVEVFSSFSENIFYSPDEEFYIGEAIQFRFPGLTSNSVYLIAKDMLNSLYFNKLYLDYYLDSEPRITVISNSSSQAYEFATRFENNIIHSNRLVNIDKNFDDLDDTSPNVLDDGSLNSNIVFNTVTDKKAFEAFVKDAADLNYFQSEEEAIKFAYALGINISDIKITKIDDEKKSIDESYYEQVNYEDVHVNYDNATKEFNQVLRNNLPRLIKCPTIENGSVKGSPNQSIFPMMSNIAFKNITDLSMIHNPEKVSGQYGIPQSVRFNNPMLVNVEKGVTDKLEDSFIGEIDGKAVYSNRIGGLIASLRKFKSGTVSGNTLQSNMSKFMPKGLLSDTLVKLSDAFFNVKDESGSMLGCMQLDMDNGNVNDQIVMIGMMMASFANEKRSPFTFEEISVALNHLKGEKQNFNKTIDGSDISSTRDTSKELLLGASKVENDANSTPIMIANVTINSVKTIIEDKLGSESETKTSRKENQESSYEKYEQGNKHRDQKDMIGSYIISNDKDKKDQLF